MKITSHPETEQNTRGERVGSKKPGELIKRESYVFE